MTPCHRLAGAGVLHALLFAARALLSFRTLPQLELLSENWRYMAQSRPINTYTQASL